MRWLHRRPRASAAMSCRSSSAWVCFFSLIESLGFSMINPSLFAVMVEVDWIFSYSTRAPPASVEANTIEVEGG